MLEHNVKHLFSLLHLSFKDFDNLITEYECSYIESEGEVLYDMDSVANYIDTQISLRESKN